MRLVARRFSQTRLPVLSLAPGLRRGCLLATCGERLVPSVYEWDDRRGAWTLLADDARDPAPTSLGAVFVRSHDHGSALWVHGNIARRLTHEAASDCDAAGRPGSDRIAFSSDRDGGADIYVLTPGGQPIRLTAGFGRCITPAWSPDGTRLAFASDREGLYQLYTMAVDGSDARKVAHAYGHSPAWSPDGQTLAYAGSTVAQSARSPKPTSVCVVPSDGGEPAMIQGGSMGSSPVWWDGDGRSLAFVRNGWLMRCDVETGSVEQVT